MHYLKEFRTHEDFTRYVSQREVFNDQQKIVGFCRKEKEIHFYAPEEPPASLYFWWSGADEPVGGKWKDRIRNAEWNIVGGTWDSENMWYQFLNPNSAVQWATYTGTVPNFGYHWEVCLDCEILCPGNASNILIDFSSVGATSCGFSIGHYPGSNSWTSNSKLNGNGSASTYRPANLVDAFETGIWYSRNISIGVRSSETAGKDEMYYIIPGIGESKTPTPFTPLQITPNGLTNPYWYIGKGWISGGGDGELSSNYYRTSIRVKDIKIYTHLENYEN